MSYEPIKVDAGLSLWNPDAPPTSPNAFDDEFDDASISGWTLFDPGSKISGAGEDEIGLTWQHVYNNNAGANSWLGYYKGIPAGTDWSVIAKGSFSHRDAGDTSNTCAIALGVAESAITSSPATADFVCIGLDWRMNYNPHIQRLITSHYSSYTTFAALKAQSLYVDRAARTLDAAVGIPVWNQIWFRVRYDSTNLYWDYSTDGVNWSNMGGEAAAVTPNQIVLMSNLLGTTNQNQQIHWHYARATSSSAFIQTPVGDRVAKIILA